MEDIIYNLAVIIINILITLNAVSFIIKIWTKSNKKGSYEISKIDMASNIIESLNISRDILKECDSAKTSSHMSQESDIDCHILKETDLHFVSEENDSTNFSSRMMKETGIAGSDDIYCIKSSSHMLKETYIVSSETSNFVESSSHILKETDITCFENSVSAKYSSHMSKESGIASSDDSDSAKSSHHVISESGITCSEDSDSENSSNHESKESDIACPEDSDSAKSLSHVSNESGIACSEDNDSVKPEDTAVDLASQRDTPRRKTVNAFLEQSYSEEAEDIVEDDISTEIERKISDRRTSFTAWRTIKSHPRKLMKKSMSEIWGYTGIFDPFQVFEVEYEACLDLEITVVRGETITKGTWRADMMDTPDPYVVLKVPGCSNSSKRTSHVDNDTNPIYNETFHIYLDPSKLHAFTLNVTLMDANYTVDEVLGLDTLPVSELTLGVKKAHCFNFTGGSKVYTELYLTKNTKPDLRFSLALCEKEKDFLQLRRRRVLASLQKILNPGDAPDNEKQVPIVAILGSGGGFRAMTCLSGAVKALQESGILDCATYIAGLSGSSWYISTLYAHDNFPDVTHEQIQKELRESVTTNWKWCLTKCASYFRAMYNKSSLGQPVSFTDFFGHLLGDVLLKGLKHKKLTDFQAKIEDGHIPFPLMTGLHAKKNVSAKTFSEWVEFSPYEIGIAKYGTFMKTEHFGCKFLVGKMIKQFNELPLHFLQGVWGSAFTILFKRLVLEGGSKDIVQIMRDAQKEGEEDINDDSGNYNPLLTNLNHNKQEKQVENTASNALEDTDEEEDEETDEEDDIEGQDDLEDEMLNDSHGEDEIKNGDVVINGRKSSTCGNTPKDSTSVSETSDEDKVRKISKTKKKSFDFPPRKTSKDVRRKSVESDPGNRSKSFESDSGSTTDLTTDENGQQRLHRQKPVRKTSKKKEEASNSNESNSNDSANDPTKNSWSQRRKTLRKSRVKKQANWLESVKKNILKGSSILNSRAGRAGEVLNPFRGLSLSHSFPLSPLSAFNEETVNEDEVDESTLLRHCRYQPLDNSAKKLFIVDSGLAFNSPYPLLLRPQRAVDIYLSFDFSQRPHDSDPPFKELLLAEKWAAHNKVAFPPIEKEVQKYSNERPKELYVFKHPTDPHCPVILHFVLVNNLFRDYKAPGVERETEEEKSFADFPIFDDENNPYSSMNFFYDELQFNRLIKLVEFNTLLCIDQIKEELANIVRKKKQHIYKNLNFTDVAKLVKTVNSYIGKEENDANKLKLKISGDQERLFKEYTNRQMSQQTSISPQTPFTPSGIGRTESYHSLSGSGSEYESANEDVTSPLGNLEIRDSTPG